MGRTVFSKQFYISADAETDLRSVVVLKYLLGVVIEVDSNHGAECSHFNWQKNISMTQSTHNKSALCSFVKLEKKMLMNSPA